MVTKQELTDFMNEAFPHAGVELTELSPGSSSIRYAVKEADLRPGGTVSGPTMFMVADTALYLAVLGEIGIVPLAVTTNLSINFIRKPDGARSIIGKCRLLKCGRNLAYGEVTIYSEGSDAPVAHATGTYAIPPH